ncbi:MAG: hypothetical protein ACK5KR_00135 [Breznakia sp.]
MIHIIGFYPYVEKRVYAQNEDGNFKPIKITYVLGNEALTCFSHMHLLDTDAKLYIMIGKNARRFTGTKADMHVLESNVQTSVATCFIVDDEKFNFYQDPLYSISRNEQAIYTSYVQAHIETQDVVVLCERVGQMDIDLFSHMYAHLYNQEVVLICSLSTVYHEVLRKKKCEVLLLSKQQIMDDHNMEYARETDIVSILAEYANLAKIIVVSMHAHKMLIVIDKKLCKVEYTKSERVYEDGDYLGAMLAGAAACYEKAEDLQSFAQMMLALSVGASLSRGLYVVQEEVLNEIKDNSRLTVI